MGIAMETKKCWDCGSRMEECTAAFEEDGVLYEYWKCKKCKREVLDMGQLHEVAERYRDLRRAYAVKISRWGTALALRIPKDIVVSQKIRPGETVRIQKEKIGFKVIPEK